jgi:uncharacterized OB-fold protein
MIKWLTGLFQDKTYRHREIDKGGMRTPSPLRCPNCGKYTLIPAVGCSNCNPRPKRAAAK